MFDMLLGLLTIFFYLCIPCHSIISEIDNIASEIDNIARNRPSYQSSTKSATKDASCGNDNNREYEEWSHTDSEEDWWMVDLGNYYRITQICFLNRYKNSFYNFFFIFIKISFYSFFFLQK